MCYLQRRLWNCGERSVIKPKGHISSNHIRNWKITEYKGSVNILVIKVIANNVLPTLGDLDNDSVGVILSTYVIISVD